MTMLNVNYHIYAGDYFEVSAQNKHCMVLHISGDRTISEMTLFAEPAVMVELLSEALTRAQDLLDSMCLDASRPGPGTRSPRRSVLGAGVSAAPAWVIHGEGG